ncbi:MAG TPA: histidine phosphatase family protein [Marinobacter sp.]|nr:histidine phosphatase family protein [Marinobacter sp.]
MATIYLIRHGQASFGRDNYDQLSARGWEQGEVLGRWLRGRVQPAAIFGGGLRRHRETAEAIARGYGTRLPDIQVLDGLSEFDHQELVARLHPEWADKQRMALDLAATPTPAKTFHEAFEKALIRWSCGDYNHEYTETWADFRRRVTDAFEQVVAQADGNDVLVATSGGPIAMIIQGLLGLSDQKTLHINGVIANASVSRILYSGPRRSLAVFNNYSHLEAENPALVTFR